MKEELISSRPKIVLLVLGCTPFVAIALSAFLQGERELWIWLSLLLFGGGLISSGLLLVNPMKLHLDETGFALSGGFFMGIRQARWADVEQFSVVRLPRGGKMICYNFKPHARKATWWMEINRRLGADASLPKLWPGKPEDLVEKLNRYRAEASTEQDRTAS